MSTRHELEMESGHWTEVMRQAANYLKPWINDEDPLDGFVAPQTLFWEVERFFKEVEFVLDCTPRASRNAYHLAMRVIGFGFDQPVSPANKLKTLKRAEKFLRGLIWTFRSTFSVDVSFRDPIYRKRVGELVGFLGCVARLDQSDGMLDPNSPLRRRRFPRIH